MKYLIKYGLVGLVATMIHVMVATLLVYLYSLDIIVANWVAFCTAFLFSYIGNTKIVFKQKIQHNNFIKFLIVSSITFLVITVVSYIGKHNSLNSYLIILITALIIPLTTFLLHKTWTFKENR